MSRKIDLNNLSEEDVLYLQQRGKRPEGAAPVPVPGQSYPEPVNTGDVGLPSAQTEPVMTGQVEAPRFELVDNYDELLVDDLKDEIDNRNMTIEEANEGLPEEEQVAEISKKGKKDELIARLRADDHRLAALEADDSEED